VGEWAAGKIEGESHAVPVQGTGNLTTGADAITKCGNGWRANGAFCLRFPPHSSVSPVGQVDQDDRDVIHNSSTLLTDPSIPSLLRQLLCSLHGLRGLKL